MISSHLSRDCTQRNQRYGCTLRITSWTQADITNARSYMQRGLRFCKNSEYLWLEYAKLETIYVGKIAGRRKILGLDVDHSKTEAVNGGDEDVDMITLPQVTAEDINPSLAQDDGVDEVALQNLASAPILTGAIPLAVCHEAVPRQGQSRRGLLRHVCRV
jgi:U3 small nucleolar RNA-associated protein 6